MTHKKMLLGGYMQCFIYVTLRMVGVNAEQALACSHLQAL
jgi:hypothetical protein